MPAERSSGAKAEALAAAFLTSRGLVVLARNVRSRFGEIDIVAKEGDVVVFVEVRLRTSARFGGASESITASKRARLAAAVEAYLATLDHTPLCRIDAVLLDALDPRHIQWLRDIG